MTISRKDRMLSIISKLQEHTPEMTDELRSNLMDAERKLHQMSEIEVEKITDNVFSAPASETKLDPHNPENLLHSSYSELKQLAKENDANPEFEEALKELRHYFSIAEKDGFFP